MAAVTSFQIDKYRKLAQEAKDSCPAYPEERFSGRGVVIVAGGLKYFTCGWVCANMLRLQGCDLPIEFWYLGEEEMDQRMMELVAPLGVTCHNVYDQMKTHPVRRMGGWQSNPYSIIHSAFEEVLFLDADNVAIVNPEFLFETEQYKDTGAVFWPDYGRLAPDRAIWEICNVRYRDEPEFESGQIVINKRRCWREINLAMHLNEHSEFYYDHIHGDKDTFHMAWHMYGTPYAMPNRGIHRLRDTMCQHDFNGRRIFQHRNMDKWRLDGGNARIKGFEMEDTCLNFVRDLRSKWNGVVQRPDAVTEDGIRYRDEIIEFKEYTYKRVGHDSRTISFETGGKIATGSARLEQAWYIKDKEGETPTLCIAGEAGVICQLKRDEDGIWRGQWLKFEQMPVELKPLKAAQTQPKAVEAPVNPVLTDKLPPKPPKQAAIPAPAPVSPSPRPAAVAVTPAAALPAIETPPFRPRFSQLSENDLVGLWFMYVRVQHDSRLMQFGQNGSFAHGGDTLEKTWKLRVEGTRTIISVYDAENSLTFAAEKGVDNVWRGQWTRFEQMPVMLVEIPRT